MTDSSSSRDRGRLGQAGASVRRHAVGIVRNPDIQAVRDLIYLMFSQIGVKVIGFLAFALLARRLTTVQYGQLETLLAWAAMGALVVEFGLNSVAVSYRARHAGRPEAQRVLAVVPAVRTLIAAVCAAALAVAAMLLVEDDGLRTLALLLALAVLLNAWNQEWLLQSLEEVRSVAIGQFVRIAVFAALVIALVQGPGDAVLVGLAELLSVACWTGYHMARRIGAGLGFSYGFDRDMAWGLVRTAAPLGINSMIWGLVQYAPTILIGTFAGPAAAAFLAAAQRLVGSLQSVSFAYHFNLYAALSRRFVQGVDRMLELSNASLRITAWLSIGPAAAAAAVSSDILGAIYGDRFAHAGGVLAILIAVFPAQLLSGHARWALIASGHTRAVLRSGLWSAATVLCGCAVLGWLWGATGGAAASLLATLVMWSVSLRACRRHGIRMHAAPRVLPPLAAAALSVAVALALPLGPLPRLLLIAVLYAGLLLIVERDRFFRDLRHLAYAKKNPRGRGPVLED